MTIGRAEATLIADTIDAMQRALGRAMTRAEMDSALKFAERTAEESMRGTEQRVYETTFQGAPVTLSDWVQPTVRPEEVRCQACGRTNAQGRCGACSRQVLVDAYGRLR